MKQIKLLEIKNSDLGLIQSWKADEDLAHALLTQPKTLTLSNVEDWLKKNSSDPDQVLKGVYTVEPERLIGVARLMYIDRENSNSELGIYIGETSSRGEGFGRAAVMQLLEIAFKQLGLHKVYLRVGEKNTQAAALYKKCGFRGEGMLLEHFYWKGSRENVSLMSIFRRDFDFGRKS